MCQMLILLSRIHGESFRNYLLDAMGELRVNVAILIDGTNADELEGLDTRQTGAIQPSCRVYIYARTLALKVVGASHQQYKSCSVSSIHKQG